MKNFTVPGIIITALLMSSPSFAQYGTGTASTPGVGATKDDTWSVATRVKKHVESHKQKKHMANYRQRHHAKAKAQTTGSGTSSGSKDR